MATQKQISVEDSFMVPEWDQRGISEGYAKLVNFDEASSFVDPQLLDQSLLGGNRFTMAQIVPGGTYEFGGGGLSAPGIRWAGDTDSGLALLAVGEMAAVIGGAAVTEWLASEFRVNYLTAGRVTFATTSGKLTDDAGFTYDSATDIATLTGGLKISALTATRIPYVGTAGLLSDSASLIWDNTNFIIQQDAGAAATNVSHRFRVSGDTQNRFEIDYDGGLRWGSGSATPTVYLEHKSTTSDEATGGPYENLRFTLPSSPQTYQDYLSFWASGATGPAVRITQAGGLWVHAGYYAVWSSPETPNVSGGHIIGRATPDFTDGAWVHELASIDGYNFIHNNAANNAQVIAIKIPNRKDVSEVTINGIFTASGYARVGTAADAAATGEFVAGTSGGARMFYSQSTLALTLYDASGNADVLIHPNGDSYLRAGNLAIGGTSPATTLDCIGTSGARALSFTSSNFRYSLEQPGDTNYVVIRRNDGASTEYLRISGAASGIITPLNISVGGAVGSTPPYTYSAIGDSAKTYGYLSTNWGHVWEQPGDTNYTIFRRADGSTQEMLRLAAAEVCLNEGGADQDFRAEGDNKTSCLLLDASDDEVAIDGRFSLIDSTPAQITGDQNNYAGAEGTATSRSTVWRISSDAARNITGIAGGLQGRCLRLVNVGAQNIVIQNQNAGSSDANKIITGTGADITLAADDTMDLWYDSTTARWRVFA